MWRWVVSRMPRPLYPPSAEGISSSIESEAGLATVPVCTVGRRDKCLAPAGNRNHGRPSRSSKSLDWLSSPGPRRPRGQQSGYGHTGVTGSNLVIHWIGGWVGRRDKCLAPAGNRNHDRRARSCKSLDWLSSPGPRRPGGQQSGCGHTEVTGSNFARRPAVCPWRVLWIRKMLQIFVVRLSYFWGPGGRSVAGPVSERTYATPDGEFSWLYALPEMELNVLERWIFS